MQLARKVNVFETDEGSNSTGRYKVIKSSILISALEVIFERYYSAVELCYADDNFIVMTVKDFIVNFEKLHNQQLVDYPNNLINSVKFKNPALSITHSMHIDDFVDNYIVLDTVLSSKDVRLHSKKIKQQQQHRCHRTTLFGCMWLFLLLAIFFLTMSIYYATSHQKKSNILAIVFASISVGSSIIAVLMLFSKHINIRGIGNSAMVGVVDGISQLRDVVLQLIVCRAIIKALEQAMAVKHGIALYHMDSRYSIDAHYNMDWPAELLNEIVLYSMGDVQQSLNNFFSDDQQSMLTNYFYRQRYVENIDITNLVKCNTRLNRASLGKSTDFIV